MGDIASYFPPIGFYLSFFFVFTYYSVVRNFLTDELKLLGQDKGEKLSYAVVRLSDSLAMIVLFISAFAIIGNSFIQNNLSSISWGISVMLILHAIIFIAITFIGVSLMFSSLNKKKKYL